MYTYTFTHTHYLTGCRMTLCVTCDCSIFQMRKPRVREGESHAHGHTGNSTRITAHHFQLPERALAVAQNFSSPSLRLTYLSDRTQPEVLPSVVWMPLPSPGPIAAPYNRPHCTALQLCLIVYIPHCTARFMRVRTGLFVLPANPEATACSRFEVLV